MVYQILSYTEFIIIFVNIVVAVSSYKSKITSTVLICETSVERCLPHLLSHNYDPGGYHSLCRSSIDTRNFNIYRASVFLPLHRPTAGVLLCSERLQRVGGSACALTALCDMMLIITTDPPCSVHVENTVATTCSRDLPLFSSLETTCLQVLRI